MKVTPRENANIEPETTEAPPPEVEKDPMDALLESIPGAPARSTIESWKANFGSVFAYVPEEDALFLLRPLRRLEYRTISSEMRQFANTAMGQDDPSRVEDQLQERVVTACLLFPRPQMEFFSMSEAGLVPTLFSLIMEHSKFSSPDKALSACFKL